MSNRLHTVEIEGFGPVTIRAIPRGALKRIIKRVGEPIKVRSEVVARGLVDPPVPDDVALKELFGGKGDVLIAIANAILEVSDVEKIL